MDAVACLVGSTLVKSIDTAFRSVNGHSAHPLVARMFVLWTGFLTKFENKTVTGTVGEEPEQNTFLPPGLPSLVQVVRQEGRAEFSCTT